MKSSLSIASAAIGEVFVIEKMLLPLIIPAFAFYIITGYGITRWSFLPKKTMLYLHLVACGMFAALILLHLAGRARTALARHKLAGSRVDATLLIILAAMLGLLVLMEFV